MKNNLLGWELIEGTLKMWETPNPDVSEVVAALERIHPEMDSPFIILVAPAVGDSEPNYCQAWANDEGYTNEIRIFSNGGFCHSRCFLPDFEGIINSNDVLFPNLSQTIRIFTSFINDPTVLPVVDDVVWQDVSEELGPVPA